jgi:hypothetical protein
MREFGKVNPLFFLSEMGREIRRHGMEVQHLALCLLVTPQANMIGVYYLPLILMAHEVCMSVESAKKALKVLIDIGYCAYDDEMEYVWIYEMAREQTGAPLKESDHRVTNIISIYKSLPNLKFLKDFYEYYKDDLCLDKKDKEDKNQTIARENRSPLQAPSKGLRSKEKEKEIEKEKEREKEKEKPIVEQTRPRTDKNEVLAVFEFWQKTMNHPRAMLDDKRKARIIKSLKMGYSVAQLCDAITGCSYTPHNIGDNDKGQRWDGLHIILRDADQIDRFIRNAENPPAPQRKSDKLMQGNISVIQQWIEKKKTTSTEDSYHAGTGSDSIR